MTDAGSKIKRLTILLERGAPPDWKRVSLCFGFFNVIHPGHLRYFRTAREQSDILVVALEGDNALQESERIHNFPETERAEALAALDLVDFVVILDQGSLEDLVQLIRPHAVVLGREFENERADFIAGAVEVAQQWKAKVVYDAGEANYATADLFDRSQHELEIKRWRQFESAMRKYDIRVAELFRKMVADPSPRILVIGDTIVDQYVACDPVGLSNEAPVVVVKEIESRDYIGGAAVVAAHVAKLGGDCAFISVTGDDENASFVEKRLMEHGVSVDLLADVSRPTTFKMRYLVNNQKLFRVSRMKEHSLPVILEDKIIQKIENCAVGIDGIVVCDFVYGIVTPRIIQTLNKISRTQGIPLFGDLQCSSQIGNIAKFKNFELLSPTEREARIALDNQDSGIEHVARLLIEKTNTSKLIVKLGGEGLIAYDKKEDGKFLDRQYFPALSANPIDVAGAGDSLLAAVSVALSRGLTLMEAAALGCCAAALAVQTVGNIPVRLTDVKNFVELRSRAANGA